MGILGDEDGGGNVIFLSLRGLFSMAGPFLVWTFGGQAFFA